MNQKPEKLVLEELIVKMPSSVEQDEFDIQSPLQVKHIKKLS